MTETRDLVAQLGIGAEEDGRPSPKKTPDNSGSSPRILVVEDERIVALDLATTLNNLGYTIAASVSSGEAAIENAVKLRPNLVLMDIRLAGEIDGIQAAEAIRKEVDLPIIYLTAHSDEPTLARARNTGPFGYVVKPFKTTELNCAIEIALHRHEIESGLAGQTREPRFLQAHVVVIVQVVEAGDALAALGEAQGQGAAEEAGCAGDQDVHVVRLS